MGDLSENIELCRLYGEKNAELARSGGVLTAPKDFYRDLFPEGCFERCGHTEDNKANGIFVIIKEQGAIKRLLTDELTELDDALGDKFSVMSPVSYYGKSRNGHNASELFAFTVDLDGVELRQLGNVLHQCNNKILPYPTYIVNSGTGLHLYYVFNEPLPLYPHMQRKLKDVKYALIRRCWNMYTSTIDKPQMQGIMQGFRMVGCRSKLGIDYPVVAYKFGDKVDLAEIMRYLPEDVYIPTTDYQSDLPLKDAREMYPDWYERRIINKQPRNRWHVKRDLYDWWLRKIKTGAEVGHRYFCIMCLAIYARKCDIDEDELRSDALALIPLLDTDKNNRFTQDDVIKALEVYNECYCTFPRKDIEKVSGIVLPPPSKRNGRKQAAHLQLARGIRRLKSEMGENVSGGGRPSKSALVYDWRQQHPEGSKSDCHRDTGLSYPTIRRWWDTWWGIGVREERSGEEQPQTYFEYDEDEDGELMYE